MWNHARMKFLALLLLTALSSPALAEKMNVKVIKHSVGGAEFAKPESVLSGGGSASTNCSTYSNAANCFSSSSTSSSTLYVPPETGQVSVSDIVMTLLLPDGRKIDVGCEDHLGGSTKANRHDCKNPTVDNLEANFSGSKVKLTWVAGFGGKKESQTFIVLQVLPAPTSAATR
jgi:hypothetical protein